MGVEGLLTIPGARSTGKRPHTKRRRDMNTYLIRLNGMPFLKVTCPYYMSLVAVARNWLLHGKQEGATVELVS